MAQSVDVAVDNVGSIHYPTTMDILSVARYVSPIQPLFAPVAMYVICRLFEGRWRKAFMIWAVFFTVLLVSALLLCLEIQQAAISKMLHTQSLLHYLRGRGW